jgi:hypothetical protein
MNNLTPLELNILQVAYSFKSFNYALLMHETIAATKEDKEIAIDNLIHKGYIIYCYDFGLRLTLKGFNYNLS